MKFLSWLPIVISRNYNWEGVRIGKLPTKKIINFQIKLSNTPVELFLRMNWQFYLSFIQIQFKEWSKQLFIIHSILCLNRHTNLKSYNRLRSKVFSACSHLMHPHSLNQIIFLNAQYCRFSNQIRLLYLSHVSQKQTNHNGRKYWV